MASPGVHYRQYQTDFHRFDRGMRGYSLCHGNSPRLSLVAWRKSGDEEYRQSERACAATRIVFPSGATLYITEENLPCKYPGKVIAQAYGRPELAGEFVKAAMSRRGLVALVEREGLINTDDRMKLILPRPRIAPNGR